MIGGEGVHGVTPERRREIEAEAVDLHLLSPVAQRVEDQASCRVDGGVEGVAAAGRVDVGAVGLLPVVAGVVDPAQACPRAVGPALGRVVEDDVEDDLDPRLVQEPHHALELAEHRIGAAPSCLGGRIRGMRREEVQGVVPPVV
ncbi:hypothetical protein ABE10_00980, partial [Bacillus toyonensis]|nr:hypothetical protein [Bacillus toyonensis]